MQERGLMREIGHSGEDTAVVLTERLRLDLNEIDGLLAAGVIAETLQ